LDLSQAACLVIVSDGILDQKGGAKGLSLGRRRLKDLLEQALVDDAGSSRLDASHLMSAIEGYQGDEEQRDDMTLIVLSLRS
jgi:serine phosphatase RsbU (regulator of sigma subunit)